MHQEILWTWGCSRVFEQLVISLGVGKVWSILLGEWGVWLGYSFGSRCERVKEMHLLGGETPKVFGASWLRIPGVCVEERRLVEAPKMFGVLLWCLWSACEWGLSLLLVKYQVVCRSETMKAYLNKAFCSIEERSTSWELL